MVEAITGIVSKFGYFPNAKKFWLLAKPHFEDKACEILEHKHQHHNHLSILPGSTTGSVKASNKQKLIMGLTRLKSLR